MFERWLYQELARYGLRVALVCRDNMRELLLKPWSVAGRTASTAGEVLPKPLQSVGHLLSRAWTSAS